MKRSESSKRTVGRETSQTFFNAEDAEAESVGWHAHACVGMPTVRAEQASARAMFPEGEVQLFDATRH